MNCLNQYCDADEIEKDDNFCYKCGHWTAKGYSFIRNKENDCCIIRSNAKFDISYNFFIHKLQSYK